MENAFSVDILERILHERELEEVYKYIHTLLGAAAKQEQIVHRTVQICIIEQMIKRKIHIDRNFECAIYAQPKMRNHRFYEYFSSMCTKNV